MSQINLFDQVHSQEEVFNKAFSRLNDEQRKAVEQTEGPVFVLAGPGTGKTQILALRIGHILKTSDIQAHNILCLTYTDAGTIAMRKRLIEFIGSAAYNVHIYTFHAFANQVIQENMHLFGSARELQPLSDLEKVEVMIELTENLPMDHPLKKLKGSDFYIRAKLENLFGDMKKEGWTPDYIHQKAEDYLEEKRNDPDMYYQRKSTKEGKTFQKGDFKEFHFKPIVEKMEMLKAGALLYRNYEKLLSSKGRYDYDDMILWVIKEFEENKQLLLRYQEQYLYFLVDEYQDTNGSQNKILEQLASYWPKPNVFAVGDDDQSIFRFQGANLENITDFQKKYEPVTVVLDKNYRSTQNILDASAALIRNNNSRLSKILQIDKSIKASGPNADLHLPVEILEFPNVSQEEAAVYYEIQKHIREKKPLNHIAVIYRKHALVEDLTKLLEAKNIPLNIRRKVNILNEPFIREVLALMGFINSGFSQSSQRDDLLFTSLIAPVFNIKYEDLMNIGRLAAYDFDSGESTHWMEIIGDKNKMAEAGVKEIERIHDIYEKLNEWMLSAPRLTLQVFFEKLLTESGLLNEALSSSNAKWKMQLLNTLFDFIKEESVRDSKITLNKFLNTIQSMEQNGVELPILKIASAEDGVHFITGHSAKGLEFETVFLMGANADNWEKSKNAGAQYSFSYPDNLLLQQAESKEEDERRVFFVAATRAEKKLLISYAASKDTGKEMERSRFVEEMKEAENAREVLEMKEVQLSDKQLFEFKGKSMEYLKLPEAELVDHNLIDKVLESYQMSVTSLNKYLRCPIAFYYENIIRVPSARNAYAGFGLAIHYGLEQYFREKQKSKEEGFGSAKILVDFFKKGMHIFRSHFTEKEFENNLHYGEDILSRYHADQLKNWFAAADFEVEHRIKNVEYRGVPIKGMIDKVEIFKDHVNVIDYKTGNAQKARGKMKGPKDAEDLGGDYWRQILFYKILVENNPLSNWKIYTGEVRLVEPDKQERFQNFKISVNPQDVQIVGDQLVDVWGKIQNHEFTKGCNDPKCDWCNFVKARYG
jgi:DNA helicase-2/ATP-dependent DNA helicase PcrA